MLGGSNYSELYAGVGYLGLTALLHRAQTGCGAVMKTRQWFLAMAQHNN